MASRIDTERTAATSALSLIFRNTEFDRGCDMLFVALVSFVSGSKGNILPNRYGLFLVTCISQDWLAKVTGT